MGRKHRKKPQVEITGWEARFYDKFLQLVTGVQYDSLIRRIISDKDLTETEIVMDLRAGTGKMQRSFSGI